MKFIAKHHSNFCRLFWTALAVMGFVFGNVSSPAAEEGLRFWMPVQVIHPLTDKLSFSMQAEIRLQDDISEFSELVLKPGLNYHFNEHWGLSGGYKYIDKYESANESDIWQEPFYATHYGTTLVKYQLRLEERLIKGIDGVLPRIRFLTHVTYPLGDTPYYLATWGAIRVNLDDKGVGPVSGFEQMRFYAGLGYHLNELTQVELGYLFRYEKERNDLHKSDHVIHVQVVIHTDGLDRRKPHASDQYR